MQTLNFLVEAGYKSSKYSRQKLKLDPVKTVCLNIYLQALPNKHRVKTYYIESNGKMKTARKLYQKNNSFPLMK